MSDLKMSRRGLLGALGVGAAAAALGGATSASAATVSPRVAFLGANQAGIATTQQLNLAFAALTVTTSSRASLVSLLQRWTTAAAALTQGSTSGSAFPALTAVPDDVGDAVDLSASNLTITIGFGPTLFRTAAGVEIGRAHV